MAVHDTNNLNRTRFSQQFEPDYDLKHRTRLLQFGSDFSSCPNKAVESEFLFGSDWKIWDPVSQKTINIHILYNNATYK